MKKQITVEIDVIRHDERRCGGCAYQGWNCCEDPWCWLFDCELTRGVGAVYLRCPECVDRAVDVEEEA